MSFVRKVVSGNFETIASGTQIVSAADVTRIEFGETGDPLVLELSFGKDDSGKAHMESTTEGNKLLRLKLINFDNPLGLGTSTPIGIGNVDNKKLYLAFTIFAVGEQRTIHYSFVSDGQS